MKKLESNAWWPALVANKDSYSLRELGEMFGVSAGAINTALKRNGISRVGARPGPREEKSGWPEGKSGGANTGRGSRIVSERRLLPWADQLGVKSDSELAELCGLSSATVARIRRSRGIPGVGSSASSIEVDRNVNSGTETFAWKVTLASGDVFVVCSVNIENATKLALAHSEDVVALERVGMLIV